MKSLRNSLVTSAPRSAILIRFAVGLIFFTQGILKFTDPQWGVLRFAKIGFPYPDFTAHFVGTFEILCGFLIVLGLLTRLASVPLLIINLAAIATTKIPELFRPEQGVWFMVTDGRVTSKTARYTCSPVTLGMIFEASEEKTT